MNKTVFTKPEIEIIEISELMECDVIVSSAGQADYGANGDEWKVDLF